VYNIFDTIYYDFHFHAVIAYITFYTTLQ